MFDHIDHIGIAVDDMQRAINMYQENFGLSIAHDEIVASQGTHAVFLSAPSGPDLELLGALGPETPIGKFLSKRGPGMHHICYAVPDLEAAIAKCLADGLRMIDEVPRLGAKGKRLAFIHPKAAGGVLLELYESANS